MVVERKRGMKFRAPDDQRSLRSENEDKENEGRRMDADRVRISELSSDIPPNWNYIRNADI